MLTAYTKKKIYDLKSNMDRFIEVDKNAAINFLKYLKSNMDRFIVYCPLCEKAIKYYLKSNMDRFIDS